MNLLFLFLVSGGAESRNPECRALDTPRRLPESSQLIDAAQLTRQLGAAAVTESSEILLGVVFPKPAGPPQAWVIDSGNASDASRRIARIVQGALRAGSAVAGTTFRMRLRTVTPIEARVERSVLCAPVPLDSVSSAPPAVGVTQGSGSGPGQRWSAAIRQLIGADGQVEDARLRPGSGVPDMDRLALEPVLARRWHPATLDGRPVAVWLENGRVELIP